MARGNQAGGRMLSKGISNSKGFAQLTPPAAVLFAMLIPHLNARGKMNGGAGYIKDEVCPRIHYLTAENITSLLSEISTLTNVKWFEHDGRQWIHALNFLSKHQRLREARMGPDTLPSWPHSGSTPGVVPDNSGSAPVLLQPEGEGEVEGEDEEEEKMAPRRAPKKPFSKPSSDDVSSYAKSIGFELDGKRFCDYYDSVGWSVGRKRMTDWRAAVRTWKSRSGDQQGNKADMGKLIASLGGPK